MISGRELRLERVTADITIVDIAARMGLSRQSVWVFERSAAVDPERARQYREALRDAIVASHLSMEPA